MLTFAKAQAYPRVFSRLTGLPLAAFTQLLPAFQHADDADRRARHPQPRQRRLGGGRTSVLATVPDRLFFILFYFRHYPTQETLGFLFGLSQPQAHHWIHRLTPLLNQALGCEQQLPARSAADLQAVLAACPGLAFIIDGTERPTRRPQGGQRQRDDYSGKKKRHTKKNIIITDQATGTIVGLGATQPGSHHDKRCADAEGYTFPTGSTLYQDTGFQGYAPSGATTCQPKKKPRGQELTAEEKAANREISRERVGVEHSIGRVKVFGIIGDVFRNLKDGFVDLVMATACGVANFRLNWQAEA
jgi:hypothetical protein